MIEQEIVVPGVDVHGDSLFQDPRDDRVGGGRHDLYAEGCLHGRVADGEVFGRCVDGGADCGFVEPGLEGAGVGRGGAG